jgi:hypothetical protein
LDVDEVKDDLIVRVGVAGRGPPVDVDGLRAEEWIEEEEVVYEGAREVVERLLVPNGLRSGGSGGCSTGVDFDALEKAERREAREVLRVACGGGGGEVSDEAAAARLEDFVGFVPVPGVVAVVVTEDGA